MTHLTKITTPFTLLDPETREALKAHGGPYEYADVGTDWQFLDCGGRPRWSLNTVYRVKAPPPKPKECWVVHLDGRDDPWSSVWPTQEQAELAAEDWRCDGCAARVVHMIEVQE